MFWRKKTYPTRFTSILQPRLNASDAISGFKKGAEKMSDNLAKKPTNSERLYTFKELREQTPLTQKDMAEIFGVSVGTISLWERRKVMPGMRHVAMMEKVFNIPWRQIDLYPVKTKIIDINDGTARSDYLSALADRGIEIPEHLRKDK